MNDVLKTRNRRSLIVDTRFQYSYVFVSVLVLILVCNTGLIAAFVTYDPLLYTEIDYSDTATLAAFEVLVIAVAAAFGLRSSKRLAGPVQGFERVFRALAEGDLSVRLAVRRGEHFHDVLEQSNRSLSALEARLVQVKEAAADVQEDLRKGRDAGPALAALTRHLDELRTGPSRNRSAKDRSPAG